VILLSFDKTSTKRAEKNPLATELTSSVANSLQNFSANPEEKFDRREKKKIRSRSSFPFLKE
jgi:hypothetical protein